MLLNILIPSYLFKPIDRLLVNFIAKNTLADYFTFARFVICPLNYDLVLSCFHVGSRVNSRNKAHRLNLNFLTETSY